MAKTVMCQNCHGNGVIKKIKNGVTTEEKCNACNGKGTVNVGTV
jgi:DnaJ-class molecular chaperone